MQQVRHDTPTQLIHDRLKSCEQCDQNIAGQCTMTAEPVASITAELGRSCPQGLWPGEVAHKWRPSTIQQICTETTGRILLEFPHGMGDHVQLTSLLLHLQKHRPKLNVHVACRAGCESLFTGFCQRVWRIGEPITEIVDRVIPLYWYEVKEAYSDSPSTKAEQCLRTVFRMKPDPKLCRYACTISHEDQEIASDYMRRINATGRVVLIHPRGRCGSSMKDLPDMAIRSAITTIRQMGAVPLLLDWDGYSKKSNWGPAINAGADSDLWPEQVGDVGRLAALAQQANLCIGIDSGPGHLFGAVTTPAIIYWRHLHPINYFGLAENVTHLVPSGHGRYIRGDRAVGEQYFQSNYHYSIYISLESDLNRLIREKLTHAT